MNATRAFFIGFYALVALLGLLSAARGSGYFQFFGFALIFFGLVSAWATVKRIFDEAEQRAHG
jgi:hypothetical protein